MPTFVTIPDPPAGPSASGRVRVDHRGQGLGAPLLLLGGMTQTLTSWSGQLRPLSETREVIAAELRGQGLGDLSLTDVGLRQQVADVAALVQHASLATPLDVSGFSFGGRVALAFAATHPNLVRRLIVTGIGAERGVLGRVIVRGWQAALATGDLEALAWISLADTLGPAYLAKSETMLESIVKAVVTRNRYEGIQALFAQSIFDDASDAWHPSQLAARITCPVLVIGGALDRLAPPDELAALARDIPDARVHVVPDVGHTVPIEAAETWRALVLAFSRENHARQ